MGTEALKSEELKAAEKYKKSKLKDKTLLPSNYIAIIHYTLMRSNVGSIVAIYLSPPVINLLYPNFLENSKPYISVTVITAMLGFFYSFIWPIVLRFGRNYYPVMMQGIKATAYLLSGVLLIPSFQVLGVAYASLIGSIIQVMVVVVLAFVIIIRQERELRRS